MTIGGDLGRTGGTVPPKFEVGDGPCILPHNILRSTVMGCEAKYELTKKRCQGQEYLWLKLRFLVKKRGS